MTRTVLSGSRRMRKKAKRTRVFLNGFDVTRDCQVADDRVGRALLLDRNEGGHNFVGPHGVARRWHHGVVRMEPRVAGDPLQ